ncbi:MAG: hypothetical protein L0H70_03260, partial [Xanthomonadales bacterium]|nr:hypothetical protein [Xanthomonadales bacterium]
FASSGGFAASDFSYDYSGGASAFHGHFVMTATALEFVVDQTALTSQTLSFTSPGDQQLSGGSVIVNPSASSGLPVSMASLTTSVCSVPGSSPFIVTFASAGTCTLQATQTGNASYSAAAPVSVSFNVIAQPALTPSVPVPTLGKPVVWLLGLLAGLLGLGMQSRRKRRVER